MSRHTRLAISMRSPRRWAKQDKSRASRRARWQADEVREISRPTPVPSNLWRYRAEVREIRPPRQRYADGDCRRHPELQKRKVL